MNSSQTTRIEKASGAIYWMIIIACLALRAAYFFATPYGTRQHDCEDHLKYVTYISCHWAIPKADDGFEFFHPPLYYYLSALWAQVNHTQSTDMPVLGKCLSYLSLALSCATFLTTAIIAEKLFKDKSENIYKGLFIAIIGTLPVLIYLGPNVNNDVLISFISVVFLWQIIKWWRSGNPSSWWCSQILIALGLLTKASAITFIPIAFGTLLFSRTLNWRKKFVWLSLSILLIASASGWFYYERFVQEHQATLVGNFKGLNPKLKLSNTAKNLLYFNPIDLIGAPCNDPWTDRWNRQYYLEYMYKSAFVDEYFPKQNTTGLLIATELTGLLLLVLSGYGLVSELTRSEQINIPLALTYVIMPLSLFCHRFLSPASCSQMFRFAPVFIVPIAYYCLKVIEHASIWPQRLGLILSILFVLLCTSFIIFGFIVP